MKFWKESLLFGMLSSLGSIWVLPYSPAFPPAVRATPFHFLGWTLLYPKILSIGFLPEISPCTASLSTLCFLVFSSNLMALVI